MSTTYSIGYSTHRLLRRRATPEVLAGLDRLLDGVGTEADLRAAASLQMECGDMQRARDMLAMLPPLDTPPGGG